MSDEAGAPRASGVRERRRDRPRAVHGFGRRVLRAPAGGPLDLPGGRADLQPVQPAAQGRREMRPMRRGPRPEGGRPGRDGEEPPQSVSGTDPASDRLLRKGGAAQSGGRVADPRPGLRGASQRRPPRGEGVNSRPRPEGRPVITERPAGRAVELKSPREIEALKRSGKLAAGLLNAVCAEVRAGVATEDLDDLAARWIKERGAQPAFLNY